MRILPAVCAASVARGFVGYAGVRPGVLAALDCTPPGRGKSQAIEHNSALPKATAPPAAKLLPAWAAARPAGSGNGLLCLAPQPGQLPVLRCASVYSVLRTRGLRSTVGPRFRALRHARWPAAPGSQLVGAVPPALTFGAIDHPVGIGYTDRASGSLGVALVNGWIKSGSACFPECPAGVSKSRGDGMSLIARFIKLFAKAPAPASIPEPRSSDKAQAEPATMNICRHFIDDEGNISHIRVRRSTE